MKKDISILIVEDEALIAMTIQSFLISAGYSVCNVLSTGEAAVEYMGKEQPDLLLFDNRLAGKLNGIEAVCLIHGKKDVPVIFITGYQFEDFVEKARTAKPIACLSKPLKFPELQATIDSFFHL